MCGISGIFNPGGEPVDRQILTGMTGVLKHRGPDGEGFYLHGNIGLGHRRLKIIDLSENGKQPMSSEDRTVWVTYNGEIYNYKDLTFELLARGDIFNSSTDSEVIVHAFEEWGIQCVSHFNGMFSFAIYDEKEKALYLVRDRLGIKPLFYHASGQQLIFASEIKAILSSPGVPREIDAHCLHNYFSLNYVTAPLTLFRNIFQLLPGHYLKVSKDITSLVRYWDVSFS